MSPTYWGPEKCITMTETESNLHILIIAECEISVKVLQLCIH